MLPNVGIELFLPGINPLNGINIRLLKRKNKMDHKYPNIIFLIEMVNYVFMIPFVSDNEVGNMKLTFKFENGIAVRKLDFCVEERNFQGVLSGDKLEIPKELYPEREKYTVKEKLLKPKGEVKL